MLSKVNIERIKEIAINSGKTIMSIYNEAIPKKFKKDNSPFTKADLISNEIICTSLKNLYKNIPILSEESSITPFDIRKKWEYFWCIDPLDGTKEYINKNGEFTINIALIYKNEPVLGVVYAPAYQDLYWAKKDQGAFLNNKRISQKSRSINENKCTVVVSRSHLSNQTKDFINSLNIKKINLISKGSSLKLCMVASGKADIYPRLSPSMEWDTAAADAIVRESGKMVYQFNCDKPLVYNKKDLVNPWFVVK